MIYINLSIAQQKLLDVLPFKDGKVIYTEVVEVDSASSVQLYDRAKRWFVHTYNSSKDVIQLDDKEKGEIIGKGFFQDTWMVTFYAGQNVNVWQTIRVQVKDFKYRYEITDFIMRYYVSPSESTRGRDIDLPVEEWNKGRDANTQKFYLKIDDNVKALITSLKDAMNQAVDEEW
ncbi:MAG TPA: DUF4468 domain-containing protein [Bacteroidota bacterium]|nr:DUF4468 domain-containing protein [Bacteroidota bacterium]